ncbi:MAG: iron-sulfur cluster repair di-iron protein [Bacteroidetes bacterium]|nr:iron-sulfur cluster repair di-iron protein [Bacteroidota bacterium]
MNTNIFIDVTQLKPTEKHPAIFDAFDRISEGEAVIIHNDHDPKPVYYQLLNLKGNCFSWTYLAKGPDIWEIEVKKSEPVEAVETIGQIVRKDIRKAEVFKRFGLDFCCGGKKTVETACREKGVDAEEVKMALSREGVAAAAHNYDQWKLSFLADYIVNEHHDYVRNNTQLIKELAEKASLKHGERQPELVEINNRVTTLLCELATHMRKEEAILFPYIKSLEASDGKIKIGFATVQDPILAMESDHELAGELMRDIRKLSHEYTAPENACNSQKLLYFKLQEFESDLFQHVHLENNILFPKAISIEQNN